MLRSTRMEPSAVVAVLCSAVVSAVVIRYDADHPTAEVADVAPAKEVEFLRR